MGQTVDKTELTKPKHYISWSQLALLTLLGLLLLYLLNLGVSYATGFNPIRSTLKAVGLQGPPGIPGLNGIAGKDGKNGINGVDGTSGQAGSNGINGATGSQGVPGSNGCISGICVSRQIGTPGTQESGNINIDGAIIAASLAGNGSNLTSLNASNIASGTLNVARGGTGVDGSAAPNGSILIGNGTGYTLSTITAGAGISVTNGAGSISIAYTGAAAACDPTSDYVCDGGNTLGATLTIGTNDAQELRFETNGSDRLTIQTDGDVGIGVSNPDFPLEIAAGSFGKGIEISEVGGSTQIYSAGTRTILAPRNSVLDVGNEGASNNAGYINAYGASIGNYTPGDKSTSVGLRVISRDASDKGIVISGFVAQTADLQQWQDSSGVILTSIDAAGKLVFGPSGSQDTNLYRSAADTLKTDDAFTTGGIITAGAVGTADNSTYLCRNSSNQIATCNSSGAGVAFVQGGNTFGATATLGTNDANSLVFETNNQTAATIASGGAVTFQNNTDTTSGLRIMDADGGTPIFNVDTTNERVGIGTATPSADLHVTSAGNTTLLLDSGFSSNLIINRGATSNYNSVQLRTGGTTHWAYGLQNDATDNFFIGSGAAAYDSATAPKFVIQPGGNVGIGDTSPDYLLDVAGTFGVDGAVTIGDAVGDTVTVNSGAWTFANDTTVALSGGVNGLNIDSNTLSIDAANNRVGIGTAAPATVLQVEGISRAAISGGALEVFATTTDTAYAAQSAATFVMTASPSGSSVQTYYGVIGSANSTSSNLTSGGITGVMGAATYSGSGTIANVSGLQGTALNASTGTIASAAGLTTTNALNYGGGTITDNFGIRVDDQTAGTNDYGIAIAGADTLALWIGFGADNTDAANGLAFGSSRDTNLYRSAANILKTDDAFTTGGIITAGAVGTADNSTYLCRNSSNQIATCNSSGAGVAFVQGGNTFGATATLGTNDANSLVFETNNQTAATIASGGAVTFQNNTDTTSGFRIMDADGGTPIFNVDTTNERVGIGTSAPAQKLDVYRGALTTSSSLSGDGFTVNGTVHGATFYTSDTNNLAAGVFASGEGPGSATYAIPTLGTWGSTGLVGATVNGGGSRNATGIYGYVGQEVATTVGTNNSNAIYGLAQPSAVSDISGGNWIAIRGSADISLPTTLNGSPDAYGGYFTATGKTGGDAVGLYAAASGGDTNYAAIFNGGNVGVGDTTPDYLLDVAGSLGVDNGITVTAGGADITGTLVANNNVTFSGLIDTGADRQTVCSSGAGVLTVDAAGNNCDTSSERFKHDITELDLNGLELVKAMNPKSFVYNSDEDEVVRWGFIAEDVAAIDPHFGVFDENGQVYSIYKYAIMAALADATQELDAKVDINKLGFDQAITDIDSRLDALEANQQVAQGLWNGGIVSDDTEFTANVIFGSMTTFNGDTEFNGNVVFNKNSGGEATIPTGSTSVNIAYTATLTPTPTVSATPQEFITGAYRVTQISSTGFVIEMSQPQAIPVVFSWTAVQAKP